MSEDRNLWLCCFSAALAGMTLFFVIIAIISEFVTNDQEYAKALATVCSV